MNKANVFLLVVVSSLLTYISTATQPAATAGVAQEKWEFSQGAIIAYKATDHKTSPTYSRAVFPVGDLHAADDDGPWKIYFRKRIDGQYSLDGPEVQKTFFTGAPRGLVHGAIHDAGKDLLAKSCAAGWEVFQVENLALNGSMDIVQRGLYPEEEMASFMIYYLRRRVQ